MRGKSATLAIQGESMNTLTLFCLVVYNPVIIMKLMDFLGDTYEGPAGLCPLIWFRGSPGDSSQVVASSGPSLCPTSIVSDLV